MNDGYRSWKDAIIYVLKKNKDAMHYTEITEQVVEGKLTKEFGATPVATVNATIRRDLKNYNENSIFEHVGKGLYRLRYDETSTTVQEVEAETEIPQVINAFGIHWSRDQVKWKNNPSLFGVQFEGTVTINFGPQKGIYLLHDGHEVIYVGRTTDQTLGSRLFQHTKDRLKGRWDRFSWFGTLTVDDDGTLEITGNYSVEINEVIIALEAILIESIEPRQNRRQGDNIKGNEYLQETDPVIEEEMKKKLLIDLLKK